MKITTAWAVYEDSLLPTILVAYDETLFDSWGGVPQFYLEDVSKAKREGAEVRELIITIPDDAVDSLFGPNVIAGAVRAE